MVPQHPIFDPYGLRLRTHQMSSMEEIVTRLIWTGMTGCCVTGETRIGKTTCIEYLKDRLRTRSGATVPVHIFSVPQRDKPTVLSGYRNLAHSCGLTFARNVRADYLADAVTGYLSDRAHGSSVLVLFVDEMQRLTQEQTKIFAEQHDRLRSFNILLIVVFVGNDQESDRLLKQLEKPSNAHIRGRFFVTRHTYKGLSTKRELSHCLSHYDKHIYPGFGVSTTQFFLPEAFESGWRLAAMTDEIWDVYLEFKNASNLTSWGMQYVSTTIRILLGDMLPSWGVSEANKEMIRSSMKLSGM